MRVKLTKSQQSLYKTWTDDYQRIMAIVGSILSDNLNLRLEKLSHELGIDIDDGNWTFDQKLMEYRKNEYEEVEAEVCPSTFSGEPEADNVEVPVGEPESCEVVDTEEKEG